MTMNKGSSSEVRFEFTGDEYVPKNVTHVQFHPDVTEVYDYAFEDCLFLREVIFNEGLLKIGQNAFHQCVSLTSIMFPSTFIEIGTMSFNRCRGLNKVSFNEGLRTIGWQAFVGCCELEFINLPSSVIKIEQCAFQYCRSLKEVLFKDGLKIIGKRSFSSTALQSITLSRTITKVDDYAFQDCSQLREVELNEGIQMIGKGAFQECPLMETVSLPSTLQKIGNAAFSDCSSLRRVLINGKLKRGLGLHVFGGCTPLERYDFPTLSTRLNDIIEAGQTDIEAKLDEIHIALEREDGELFALRGGMGGICTHSWSTIKASLEKIDRLITHYEFKEATVLFELALWKAEIDQADDTSTSDREARRIEVPGPVKDAIMLYFF